MLVKINWTPSRKDLRGFALVMIIGFPLLGLFFGFDSGERAVRTWRPFQVLGAFGAAVAVISLLCPPAGKWLYRGWMGIGYVLGSIVSPIVIALAYYGVITPIGLALRLTGHDPLQLRKPDKNATYWLDIKHRTDVKSYERQF